MSCFDHDNENRFADHDDDLSIMQAYFPPDQSVLYEDRGSGPQLHPTLSPHLGESRRLPFHFGIILIIGTELALMPP